MKDNNNIYNLKVIDFGTLSKLKKDKDKIDADKGGTLYFMPPEVRKIQKGGKKTIDGCKADIYSLGFSILLLINPFSTKEELEKYLKNFKHKKEHKYYELLIIIDKMVHDDPE